MTRKEATVTVAPGPRLAEARDHLLHVRKGHRYGILLYAELADATEDQNQRVTSVIAAGPVPLAGRKDLPRHMHRGWLHTVREGELALPGERFCGRAFDLVLFDGDG